ncbi:MAG: 50S ribosomal protein L15 [Deltaproteobacteria bacterium]|nr:50S ribosomal protein L15 [Deltaproteobacteria bacterium]
MKLSELAPPKGARSRKVRVGRGESSGLGKTSGRGGKGQTARTGGKVRAGFEGGQMPLYRRLPKLGFRSRQRRLGLNQYTEVNLSALDSFAEGETIDAEKLASAGIRMKAGNKAGVKILGGGTLSKKVSVVVDAISESARKKIESLGGSVTLVEKVERQEGEQTSSK